MAKAITIILLVSMPMSWAVSGSSAVACMARPVRDMLTKRARAAMQSGAATMTKSEPLLTLMDPMCQGPAWIWESAVSLAFGYQLKTACWSARERPMAVMRGPGVARRAVVGRRTVPPRRR